MICVEEYGDYIRPKQIVRSNRVCCEHKLCYTLQGELMPKVYYRVNKYQLLHIGLYHTRKKKFLFLLVFLFCFVFGCCIVGSFWHGKKIIVKEYHQNHLLIFWIVCKIMAFFYHVIFYKKLLFFVQIILMNWS